MDRVVGGTEVSTSIVVSSPVNWSVIVGVAVVMVCIVIAFLIGRSRRR